MPWNTKTDYGKRTEREFLKFPAGLDSIKSVVIRGSTVATLPAGDASGYGGRRVLLAGTVLAKIAGDNKYKPYAGAGTSGAETQQLVIDATGGTFTLTFSGQTTGAIAFDATAAQVKAALEALSNVNEVSVSGGPGSAGGTNPYFITFVDPSGDVAQMTTGAGSLTGGAGTATVTVPTETPAGVLGNDVEFLQDLDTGRIDDEAANMFYHGCVFKASKLVGYAGNESAIASAMPTCKFE